MRAGCLAAVLAVLPTMPWAQSVVQSGEHDGFTRLVAPIAPGTEWRVDQIGRTVTFRAESAEATFDLSNVFELIRRDRIASVRAAEQGFAIELACDCVVTSDLFAGRFVVLDVTLEGSQADAPSTPPAPVPDRVTAAPVVPGNILPLLPERRPSTVLAPLALPELARAPLTETEKATLEAVQEELAAGLGAAATSGLIKPVPGRELDLPLAPDAEDAALDTAMAEEEPAPAAAPGLGRNVRITSSMDVQPVHRRRPTTSLSGHDCLSDEIVDVSSWSDGRGLYPQLGEVRQDLYGEFDKLDEKAALRLAKLYLHFGFGAEAAQILRMREKTTSYEHVLRGMAQIMQNDTVAAGSTLPSLIDCATDVSLWSMLATDSLDVTQNIDPSPALRALNKLPVHLRKILAPELSRRLLRYGDNDAAAAALRSVERLPSELPPEVKLAQAELAIEENAPERAKQTLEEVISENAEPSPEALIALFDKQLEKGAPIDAKTADLIAAYAKELQGSPLGPELRRVHVIALAKSGQFDTAFVALDELGGEVQPDATDETRIQLIRELTDAASDVVFLEHAFTLSARDYRSMPVNPRLALAERLLDLGFPGQAISVIDGMATRPVNKERQMLAAQVALALSQPNRALAELGELDDGDATLLRAEAHRMAGSYAEAQSQFSRVGNEEAATVAAWLSDDISTPQLTENPLFGPTIRLTQAELSPPTEVDGMIAKGSAVLAESGEARQILTDLLSAAELDIEPTEIAQ